MKELTKEYFASMQSEYENDRVAKAVRRAMFKTDVMDLAKVQEKLNETQHQFSINIPTMKATSQGQSGRCWIFAGCNFLREEVSKKCNIEDFELSQNYIAYCDKLEKINTEKADIVDSPILSDCPINYECTLTDIYSPGSHDLFIGKVEKVHCDEEYLNDDGTVNWDKINLL